MIVTALPGSPAPRAGLPPAGEPERAVRAVEASVAALAPTGWFGFLEAPALRARVETLRSEPVIRIDVAGDRLCRRATSAFAIEAIWRRLWTSDDWWEPGWLPSGEYLALDEAGRRLVWRALNGGREMPWRTR